MSTPRRDIEHAVSLLAQARSAVPSWTASHRRLDTIIGDLHVTLSKLDADIAADSRISAVLSGQEEMT